MRTCKDYVPGQSWNVRTKALERQRFRLLDIDAAHIDAVALLPHKHRDPFDRMIIAQAKVEVLTVVTADRAIGAYDIATVLI